MSNDNLNEELLKTTSSGTKKSSKERLFHLVDVVSGEQDYETDIIKGKNEDNEEISLEIFTKRAYEKEVSEDIETAEVGTIKPWQEYKEDRKKSIGKAYTSLEKGLEFNVYKKKPLFVKGYAHVEDNKYVYVARNPIFLILLLLLLLLGCFVGCWKLLPGSDVKVPEKVQELLPIADSEDWDGEYAKGEESEAIAEQTEIPGYANLFVSKDSPSINLINPDGNTVYFKYIISENDVVLFETDLIEPNKMIPANLYELLTEGEHVLKFQINTYDVETQAACNGATQTVNMIKK